ncbi:hypothetical protein [Luteitalea sp.]|uniref:hypothetical protein n=1 Tax=Luteitalea sp. TaxID=2004800 RepID=UPI0025BDA334|nr:hypothetical protein [Luteitalea sp.]
MIADPVAALRDLVTCRVFFGHQSVGANVLDGVRDWLAASDLVWPIVEAQAAPPAGGALIHAAVGRNGQPRSKCEDFRRALDAGTLGHLDVAALKFCYVDVQTDADAGTLAEEYRATLDDLAHRHPATVMMPVTVPLTHVDGGLGVWAREVLGRPNTAKLQNLARQVFNDRVRQGAVASPPFDLARAESTRPDGTAEVFTYRGRRGESLVAAYSDDGRHLNAAGRRTVAATFLQALAAAVSASRPRRAGAPDGRA